MNSPPALAALCSLLTAAAFAVGSSNLASYHESFAAGNECVSDTITTFAIGEGAHAYSENMFAHGGKEDGTAKQGACQYTRSIVGGSTAGTATTILSVESGQAGVLFPDYTRSVHFRIYVVARRTTGGILSSAWLIEGLLEGDGVSAYTFVGGAPPATLIVQDAGAAGWSTIVQMDGSFHKYCQVVCAGNVGDQVSWTAVYHFDEVKL